MMHGLTNLKINDSLVDRNCLNLVCLNTKLFAIFQVRLRVLFARGLLVFIVSTLHPDGKVQSLALRLSLMQHRADW
jgi:hypothetical protein